jgi:diaminohydroxyphosphoribosylaminopyrimidine deaminase/5-amino-6-(5-phosphoribosylamino)uracil reductase
MNISVGDAITREQAQDLALTVAESGAGFVSPNPLVGCVIVDKDHRFLASGYHGKLGGDHAEIDALKKVPPERLSGATVYVTLEPCAHQGRTPPCAERLMREPLKAVVIGIEDPNPLVAGKGIKMLRDKGIFVDVDRLFGQKCERLTEMFLWHIQNKMPFVALKVATSLDGKIALKSGESQWITSEEARRAARELRGHYDATLIGTRTLVHDNPRLDFRETRFEGKKLNRIVIWDPTGKAEAFLPNSEILKIHRRENITVLRDAVLDSEVLKRLYGQGIYSLFVEGGGYTVSEFIKAGLANKIHKVIAPCLMGDGRGWTESLSIDSMDQRVPLEFTDVKRVGSEIFITASVKKLIQNK